ncbi:MAG TPA: SpoIIE family protein phosphatase [Armatimonadota bacterium]|nr:SpoIIE family protein phosphatase [Armatimonadota bacterium]
MQAPTLRALPELRTKAPRPKVLVADDNVGLAEIWSFVLEDAGCDVTIADSGGAALAAVAREAFDIAVLDLQMPDLSGLEVFTAIQADNADVQGIIITGHASMESAMDAVNRGVFGYLVKPVTPDALRVMVERALERRRLTVENRAMLSHLSALQQVLDTALRAVGVADAFQSISQVMVDAMGVDQVTLILLDEGGNLVATAAYPVETEIYEGPRLRPGEGFSGRVFAECQPLQIRDIRDSSVRSEILKTMGIRSLVGVPLLSGGKPIGVLHVGTRRERVFDDSEIRLLLSISERIGLAVEKERLLMEREAHRRELEVAYQRERRIAETLQRSFLPNVDVGVPGIAVAHLYQPALSEAEVGGDFYDIIELNGGVLGLVMGDISGKGLDAAVYTALTKYTIRSYALEDPDPGRVMSLLSEAFMRQANPEIFTTLFYGVLDIRRQCIAYVNAGHEPPILYRAGTGKIERICSSGPLAGVISDPGYETQEIPFHCGDLMLLYTDGATDASHDGAWLGIEGLEDLLRTHIEDEVQNTLNAIWNGIGEFAHGKLRDDVALMLVRACG